MKRRVILAVRATGVMIALGLIVVGILSISRAHRSLHGYEHAPQCAARVPDDLRECITTVSGVVVKRSTYTTHTDTEYHDPFPPFPPAPPPPFPPFPQPPLRLIPVAYFPALLPFSPVIAADTVHYRVTVRLSDGKSHEFAVGRKLYDKALQGVKALLQVWRGRFIVLTVESESVELDIGGAYFWQWLTAWTGLLLLALSLRPLHRMRLENLWCAWLAPALLYYVFDESALTAVVFISALAVVVVIAQHVRGNSW